MHWWYLIVFGYLVVCWAGSIYLAMLHCPEEETGIDAEWSSTVSKYPLRMWACIILVVIFLGPFVPIVLGYCYVQAWRDARAWRKFIRTHRPVSLEHLHVANMPKAAQDHIERCEPDLQDLGFSPEGSYLLKPEPFPIYSKLFISAEGETIVDVSLIDDTTVYSFTSVLENGHVLETACGEAIVSMGRFNESGRFTADMVERNLDADCFSTLYQRHRDSLVELERRFESQTLEFDMDQVKALMRYANCVFGQVKYALGELDDPPPPPVLPDGRVELIPQH